MMGTEDSLTKNISDDVMDAWLRLKETALSFGEQSLTFSDKAILFTRKGCYLSVRPQKSYLGISFFLGRKVESPIVRETLAPARGTVEHTLRINHQDQIGAPLIQWLKEAYEVAEQLAPMPMQKRAAKSPPRQPPPKKKVPISEKKYFSPY